MFLGSYTIIYKPAICAGQNTVEPLLSGHPRGNCKWPIDRGWPLNKASSGIGLKLT